jgi:glycogen(starch) synthase
MRILIWSDAFWPQIGGLEIFCMRLTTELSRRGHECLVITDERTQGGDSSPYHYGPTPVYQFPFRDLLLRADLVALRSTQQAISQLVDTFRPDVIHVNASQGSVYYFVRQQKRRRSPAVLTLHDCFLMLLRGDLAAASFQNVDSVVAISEFIRGEVLDYEPALSKKVHTILNALPVPPVPVEPLPWPPRLLAFGRLVFDKGFDLAIEAFAQIAAEFPEATLTVAGNGIEAAALCQLADKAQLTHRIHFTGWVEPDRIPALINQHTLILVPSRWQEPFGLVALQSAQMGRPVIASRRGGLPEIVQDGVTGCLFENENCNQLAAHLRLLIDDRAHTEALGRQARMSALQRFDFANFVTAYEQRYKHASLAHGNLQN